MSRELAELFISYNIDAIDEENWIEFFEAFWEDSPCHMNHSTGMDILAILDEAGINYSQKDREHVLVDGVNTVFTHVLDRGQIISMKELYTFDAEEYMDGASNWLGYTLDEFTTLLYKHKDELKAVHRSFTELQVVG